MSVTGLLRHGDLGENRALGPGLKGPGEPSRAQVMQTSWGTCTQAGGAHVSITGLFCRPTSQHDVPFELVLQSVILTTALSPSVLIQAWASDPCTLPCTGVQPSQMPGPSQEISTGSQAAWGQMLHPRGSFQLPSV